MARRPPAVAGTFYEADPGRLRLQIERCLGSHESDAKLPFLGAVVPHAGLMYSGSVAGAFYQSAHLPERLIILCPNHTGAGRPAAINETGSWSTPLGDLAIDSDLARELMNEAPSLEADTLAHRREHSLEVQLPFIQVLAPTTRFVPICLALPSFELCTLLGEAMARVIASHPAGAIGILASSDLNHYESQRITMEKDQIAIDRIVALDPQGLWNSVVRQDISMCGIVPATTMLIAVNRLQASEAELIRHATSGDVNGDYNAVVGYASVRIH